MTAVTDTKRIIQLSSKDGFMDAFFDLLKTGDYPTHILAYEALETEYKTYFERRRYSSYESFRIVRDRKNK